MANKPKRVESDQPTALIAPSDYEHIFKGDLSDFQKNTKIKKSPKKIPSDQPTCLIAPSDYEHIFKGSFEKPPAKPNRIPSDTPTALIAPSDFEHIYRDPSLAKALNIKKSKAVTKKNISVAKVNSVSRKSGSSTTQKNKRKLSIASMQKVDSKSKTKDVSLANKISLQHEVLPKSICHVVDKFIAKQKKNYSIFK